MNSNSIRFRIAGLFTLLTALALILFMTLVYNYTRLSKEQGFYDEMMAKARIEGQYVLEKDEMAAEIYEKIIEKQLIKLPQEQEYIINLSDSSEAIKNGLITSTIINKTINNGSHRYLKGDQKWASLFYEDNEGDFIILVTAVDEEGEQELEILINSMGVGLLITLLTQFAVGWAFAKSITYPLVKISGQLKKINASDLSSRVKVINTKDELGELATTINGMLNRLEMGFEAQKKFVSNASHELKTPLTVILGESEILLRKGRKPDEYIQTIKLIREEAERLSGILYDLIQLTEVSSGHLHFQKTRFRMEDTLLNVQSKMFHYAGKQNLIKVIYETPGLLNGIEMHGNQRWIELSLSNVLKNALKFSGFKAEVLIKISLSNIDPNVIQITIDDKGIGIPDAELESISDPFFRASNAGHIDGHGVGLSIVKHIIKLHGGHITIKSQIDKGTKVEINLPLNG